LRKKSSSTAPGRVRCVRVHSSLPGAPRRRETPACGAAMATRDPQGPRRARRSAGLLSPHLIRLAMSIAQFDPNVIGSRLSHSERTSLRHPMISISYMLLCAIFYINCGNKLPGDWQDNREAAGSPRRVADSNVVGFVLRATARPEWDRHPIFTTFGS
jgi:hypothetical protein